jgi:hypothetical protein
MPAVEKRMYIESKKSLSKTVGGVASAQATILGQMALGI